MSWRNAQLAAVLLAAAALGLAGCGFQPLYGTTASGSRLAEVMAGVDITPVPGRVGQKVRNELIFENTGGNYAAPSRFRLDIIIKETVTDELVRISGDVTGQVYQLNATFKLVSLADGKTILQGQAISRAPYDRYQQIFSNVRARYDAENRAARTVAESIKTRVAAFLSSAA
jgi:LPS-assembly lipoprotein